MTTDNILLIVILYASVLFLVAYVVDQFPKARESLVRSPLVYTLSISVYCTSWTFYGAVGSAARSGLEFITIYLGPTLVFVGWWLFLRRLVRVGKDQKTTSIADLLSSRFGKSAWLAGLVTIIAVITTTPYIALQIKAVATSFETINGETLVRLDHPPFRNAFWVTLLLGAFAIMFGTRTVGSNERHHGLVAAIALEGIMKLVALLAVGIFVVFWLEPMSLVGHDTTSIADLVVPYDYGARWMTLIILSAGAIICLPRQFHVTVVENNDERHLATASWMFPAYLFLICLFVLPIAAAGTSLLPVTADPDMYVLTVPLVAEQEFLAVLAFLGGVSSATAMVIVASIALSIMITNHLVMPLALRFSFVNLAVSGDILRLLIRSRRISILVILLLGLMYFELSGAQNALASIGLVAFAGVAQFLPLLVAGLFWERATALGAITALSAGSLIWAWTLFLPSFAGDLIITQTIMADGPFGLSFLRPTAMFGFEGLDPLVHATVLSLGLNTSLLVLVSLLTSADPMGALQARRIVNIYRKGAVDEEHIYNRSAAIDDLYILAQRILGTDQAHRQFKDAARIQGRPEGLPDPTNRFISDLERSFSASVGAAPAHALISRVVTGQSLSVDDIMRIADETQQIREYSTQLEHQSRQLELTAGQLKEANLRLTELDEMKDDFLSQVSHELRTPMTSIRAFVRILQDEKGLSSDQRRHFLSIITTESERLTRLLDQILDLSVLERGELVLDTQSVDPEPVVARAVDSLRALTTVKGLRPSILHEASNRGSLVDINSDRFEQVVVNLVSNAIKFNDSEDPMIHVDSGTSDDAYWLTVSDNGPGIPVGDATHIFGKFARGRSQMRGGPQGSGLGLAISYQIIQQFGGKLSLRQLGGQGASFHVSLPLVSVREDVKQASSMDAEESSEGVTVHA